MHRPPPTALPLAAAATGSAHLDGVVPGALPSAAAAPMSLGAAGGLAGEARCDGRDEARWRSIQLAIGPESAMATATSGLALLALGSDKTRATVTQELVKLLASEDEAVRERASSALRDVAAGEKMNKAQRQGCESNSGGGGGCAPLVQLLQDGLKDGNVEAQE